MKIVLKEAHLQNLTELLKIERECFASEAFTKEQIEILLLNPNSIGLLAEINSEVAGFIIGGLENYHAVKAGHVYTLDVALKHRRLGIGLLILKEMESIFLKKGAEVSYLEVRVDNQAARKLYKRQGYVEAESLNDYYSIGVHGVRLIKKLKR